MQLALRRGQSKGLMGGISFEVFAQVRLSTEEQDLIQKYKQESVVVLQRPVYIFGKPTDRVINLTVGQLIQGESFKCKDLGEVIGFSDNAVRACQTLKTYLDVAKTFGGEEILEVQGFSGAEQSGS